MPECGSSSTSRARVVGSHHTTSVHQLGPVQTRTDRSRCGGRPFGPRSMHAVFAKSGTGPGEIESAGARRSGG